MKLLRYFGLYVLIACIVLHLYPLGEIAAIEAEPHIDISTSAKNGRLFVLDQLKPGDWASREIKVENKGNRSFSYNMTAQFESGDQKLYQALLLHIEQDGESLFRGSLSDFSGLDQRFLAVADEEDFTLTVEFPYEYGNDYQGLSTVVLFIFTAEGKVEPPQTCEERGDCPQPPQTCEERGDCPQPPQTCEERGDCPQPPQTCEERGDCPQPPQTCEQRGDCSEPKDCEQQGTCVNNDQECAGNKCGESICPPGESCIDESVPEHEIEIIDEEVPVGAPDHDSSTIIELEEQKIPKGGQLPQTSVPWYSLLLLAVIGLAASGAMMWQLKKRSDQG